MDDHIVIGPDPVHRPAIGPTIRDEHTLPAPDPSMAETADNEARPIGPHDPASMHRREDDAEAMASSPDFHDRPGSGRRR
jgi:hypothetical protein